MFQPIRKIEVLVAGIESFLLDNSINVVSKTSSFEWSNHDTNLLRLLTLFTSKLESWMSYCMV